MKSRTSFLLRTLVVILVIGTAFTLLFQFVDEVSGGWVIELAARFAEMLPYVLVNYKIQIYLVALLGIIGIILICAALIVWLAEKRAEEKTNEKLRVILDSIDKVFRKQEALISLPPEFADTENQLNAIRNETLHNERLAKEAEQRKNDLVVYLAHDLKTPLTSVIGYLTLLRDEEGISIDLRRKYEGIALDKARRLEDLINEFFDVTRFNLQNINLERQEFDLSIMLRQLSDEFYPILTERGLTCDLVLPEELVIFADPDKLARVFDNILRNALAYSTPGTTVWVKLESQEESALLTFENHGMEIPKHKLAMIFEKFYRMDEARSTRTGGAGLGLAIAKELVVLHGGEIWAESDEGVTRFFVRLPRKGVLTQVADKSTAKGVL